MNLKPCPMEGWILLVFYPSDHRRLAWECLVPHPETRPYCYVALNSQSLVPINSELCKRSDAGFSSSVGVIFFLADKWYCTLWNSYFASLQGLVCIFMNLSWFPYLVLLPLYDKNLDFSARHLKYPALNIGASYGHCTNTLCYRMQLWGLLWAEYNLHKVSGPWCESQFSSQFFRGPLWPLVFQG